MSVKKTDFRHAADEIWALAKMYETMGVMDLAEVLKDMSTQLHELARKKEMQIRKK